MKPLFNISLPRFLLYTTLAFALFAFVAHKPLPAKICQSSLYDRAAVHVVEPVLRFTYFWPSRHLLTPSTRVWWTRLVLDTLSVVTGPFTYFDRSIRRETTHWEGVRVRVYSPVKNSTTNGAVIFIHGGGFAIGSIDLYDTLTWRLSKRLNSVLVSIDYRLSPETPFPGGLNDCEKVVDYFMHIAAEKYHVNTSRVVITGDSAGGNLAAAITQRRKLRGALPEFAGQVLIYPFLHLADLQSPAFRYFNKYMDGYAFPDPEALALYAMMYLGIDMDKYQPLVDKVLTNGHIAEKHKSTLKQYLRYDKFNEEFCFPEEKLPERAEVEEDNELQEMMEPWLTNPDIAPLLREDLTGLPKAFILIIEHDMLRDDGILYAKRLEEAGVPVTLRNYEHGFHAMLNFHHEIAAASASVEDIVKWTEGAFISA